MQMKHTVLVAFAALSFSHLAFSRSGPKPGDASASYIPDVKKGEGWAWAGTGATQYRPPAGLTTSKFEADVSELRRIRERTNIVNDKINRIAHVTDLEAKDGDRPLFAGSNNAERVKDQQRQVKELRAESENLQQRAHVLEDRYSKALKEAKANVAKTDAALLEKISSKVKNSPDTDIKVSQDDAAAVIGRFAMMDLTTDVRDFLTDTKDAQRDLEILEMKLDQSIMGTYVAAKNADLTKSKSFCSAVQSFSAPGVDCQTAAADDFAPPIKNEPVEKYLNEKRGHKK